MELSLTKLPWYSQLAAFAVLAGVGVGAFVYYYEQPARADMTSRQTQLNTLKADVEKGRETARKLPEFKKQVEELESRLSSLKAVLPEEKDAADLLRRMQTLATQSNLTITEFRPAPVVTKQLHAEWPIHLELTGTYHNLATFFDRISKFTRIVNISGLDVKGRSKQDPNATIEAACVATTFVLLEKPQPDPKAATSTATSTAQQPLTKKVA
jgi:type IV pilus assembly protein PilO